MYKVKLLDKGDLKRTFEKRAKFEKDVSASTGLDRKQSNPTFIQLRSQSTTPHVQKVRWDAKVMRSKSESESGPKDAGINSTSSSSYLRESLQ
ncbi:hypothetical protein TNCV_1179791 [Trichonephila clavipes]|nr:hypothetical protein TNCV_1179791 [Trichonephila clavipes]